MKYKRSYGYKEKVYNESYFSGYENNIADLLNDLEDEGEIETTTLKLYNVKGCNGYYTDDEIDEFLEELVDMEIIEDLKE